MQRLWTLAAIALLPILCGCVSSRVTQPAPPTTNFKDFKSISYSVHATDVTEYGSDVRYGRDCVSLFGTLLGMKLKDMGYAVAPAGERADISIDVAVTEASKGNSAARLLVGFGAGRAALLFNATFNDAHGRRIAALSGGRSYTGMELNQSPFPSKMALQTRAATRSVQQLEEFIENDGKAPAPDQSNRSPM